MSEMTRPTGQSFLLESGVDLEPNEDGGYAIPCSLSLVIALDQRTAADVHYNTLRNLPNEWRSFMLEDHAWRVVYFWDHIVDLIGDEVTLEATEWGEFGERLV